MKYINNLYVDEGMKVFAGLLVFFVLVFAPGTSLAADYCHRHLYNESGKELRLKMCNTHGDCANYLSPPRTPVQIAIPSDVAGAILVYSHNGNLRIVGLKINSSCRITGVVSWFPIGGDSVRCVRGVSDKFIASSCIDHLESYQQNLSEYPQKAWLTLNNPADGDIKVFGGIN